MVGVGILGYGTVGSGVYQVIKENGKLIEEKSGEKLQVLHVLDLREFPGDEVASVLTKDFEKIISDKNVKIITEVMGGIEPAYTFTKQALLAGKSVVTSNKALVAEHGPELLTIAREKNVSYLFEASVGGAIPIIRPLTASLTADKILEISGILNGTTNYILTKMTQEGKAFGDVLKVAQELGYAEADPTADVEGHDACRKIAILSSLAYGKTVDFKEIYTEGITKITDLDIEYAKAIKGVIKLIGASKKTQTGISARVAPCILKNTHPLATVNDAYNAIFVKGNMSGDTMYYGSGAGKLPTASAVVADIIEAVRNMGKTVTIHWNCQGNEKVDEIAKVPVNAMVRVGYNNKEEAKAALEKTFGAIEFIEIAKANNEFAVVIKNETEGLLKEKVESIKLEKSITGVLNLIRMEE